MTKRIYGTALAALSLTGCGMLTDNPVYGPDGLIYDRSLDYQAAQQHESLVIPPHLRAKNVPNPLEIPAIGETASEQRTGGFVVPRPEFFYADSGNEKVNLARDTTDRHDKVIVVDESIGDVWVKLQEFWAFNGIEVAKSDPQSGVMETQWMERSGAELSMIDSWIKRLTFSDDKGPSRDKLRVDLRPDPNDTARTSIKMRHVKFPADQQVSAVNWDEQSQDVSYKTDMMFEMLRYLSKASGDRDATSLVALRDKVNVSSQLGRDSRGNPVLRLDGSIDTVWQQLSVALDKAAMDVGTRDQKKGVFYMTYTTSTPFEETQEQGFFDWLHSDRGEITLSTSFLDRAMGAETSANDDPNAIRYSSKTVEQKLAALKAAPGSTDTDLLPPEEGDLAERKGFKIWFGGEVIYVFGDNRDEGVYNENTGKFEHVGQYQLKLNRTRSGVYLIVLTHQGLIAPAIVAEELLWEVKEQLPKKG